MDYSRQLKLITLGLLFVWLAGSVKSQCDRNKADVCVKEMEAVISVVLETTVGVTRTEKLQQLCLDVVKGNNMTQCFIEAAGACTESSQVGPNDVIMRWERVMQDLYGLCDGACPNFLERTVNITQCTGLIRFDALYDSSYKVFCGSLNESLQCVSETSEQCPQFSHLFYDLLPQGMDKTASTICTGGCDNFDQALGMLETCKKYVTELPEDLNEACLSYEKFKTCIKMSEAPVTCPMFGSLMEVLYPQHIFGLYEKNCNTSLLTADESDKCGAIGVARVDHCVRILALAWPLRSDGDRPTQQQCKDFVTGTRCLERAGFSECANLQQHFLDKIEGRQKQRLMMQQKCPALVGGSGGRITSGHLVTGIALLFALANKIIV